MTMPSPTSISTLRNAILLALGLTASSLAGAGGCTAPDSPDVCANSEIDYATCTLPGDAEPNEEFDPNGPQIAYVEVCFDGGDGCDPCDVEAITGAAIEQAARSCSIDDLHRVTLACGPNPESEDCCYKVRVEGDLLCGQDGRPLYVGDEQAPRLAALQAGAAWLADMRGFAQVRRPEDPALSEQLRGYWLNCARYEHASVAAFARVGLQLMSLGAPAELLRATQEAIADEVRHAQLCFGLAAAYGAPATQAGPLSIAGCIATGMDLEATLREAIVAGALGEGAAALEALDGARTCDDPVVRAVLLRIAEDEQRHALLAYQTVQWALLAYPERARELVRGCLRERHVHAPMPTTEPGADHHALASHGLISPDARARLRAQTWTEIVAPLLTAMLSPSPTSTRAAARC